MNWIIVFDDRKFFGHGLHKVHEYPDAKLFTSKKAAEKAARAVNSPSTVISTEDYAS